MKPQFAKPPAHFAGLVRPAINGDNHPLTSGFGLVAGDGDHPAGRYEQG
jgi:hypothetical protein